MDDPEREDHAFQRRSYELSILNDVARTLNASVDLPTMMERALEKVVELLDLETGWVLLLDEDAGEPYLAAAQNLPPGLRREPERMEGGCYCLNSFCSGDLGDAANVGVVTCSRLRQLELAHGDTAGLRFHASIPLQVCDDGTGEATPENKEEGDEDPYVTFKRLGMLNVASPEWRQLTDDELELLRTIADILGVAIERARLHDRRLEAAQTKERNRLAREIHDTIAQDFSAIAFQLEAADTLLEQNGELEHIRSNVATGLDLAQEGLEKARRSVLDLRATPLEGHTIDEALAALAEEADATNAPDVVFEAAPATGSLPPAVGMGVYRIAQEALHNALHHAGAAHVVLRLGVDSDEVRLTVEDDGRGFDVDAVTEGRTSERFGLIGMRERAYLLDGTLHIESTIGTGTRITAEVPLPAPSSF